MYFGMLYIILCLEQVAKKNEMQYFFFTPYISAKV